MICLVQSPTPQSCGLSITQNPVGGSLLPIAVGRSMPVLADPPQSGASPLPQVDWVSNVSGISVGSRWMICLVQSSTPQPCGLSITQKPVGGSLLPIAVGRSMHVLADLPQSGASPLPQVDCISNVSGISVGNRWMICLVQSPTPQPCGSSMFNLSA